MNKKIFAVVLVSIFLLTGFSTASYVVVKPKVAPLTTVEGRINCTVYYKNLTPQIEFLPGIKITLTNPNGSISLKGETDEFGRFNFTDLLVDHDYGEYILTANLNGNNQYSNLTITVRLTEREPTRDLWFGLESKARSRDVYNSILNELFSRLPILQLFINLLNNLLNKI